MAFEPPTGTAPPPRAGWWQRVGAQIVDGLVIAVAVVFAVCLAGGGGDSSTSDALIGALAGGLIDAPLLLIRPGEHNGQTLGKQVAGYRVVREDGQPITLGTALLREVLGKTVLGFIGP